MMTRCFINDLGLVNVNKMAIQQQVTRGLVMLTRVC